MTNTPNYNLSIAEGTDTVNLLTQCYPNFETIDTAMKENKDAGVGTATETKTGTNHSVIRNNTDGAVFAFTATSNYVAGDTFTVDAQAVTVTTPDGQSLPSGAFVINKSVLCRLDGTVLTIFTGGGSTDAETLGGELPSFYAKQSDMDIVENDVNVLNSNLTDYDFSNTSMEQTDFKSMVQMILNKVFPKFDGYVFANNTYLNGYNETNIGHPNNVTLSGSTITINTSISNAWGYLNVDGDFSRFNAIEMVIHVNNPNGGNMNTKLYSNGIGYDEEVNTISGLVQGNDYTIRRSISSFKVGKTNIGVGIGFGATGSFTVKSLRFVE